jgi:predicted RNase H-like nuclease (RuvC/YqgF family)
MNEVKTWQPADEKMAMLPAYDDRAEQYVFLRDYEALEDTLRAYREQVSGLQADCDLLRDENESLRAELELSEATIRESARERAEAREALQALNMIRTLVSESAYTTKGADYDDGDLQL